MATIKSEVATGRRINGLEGLIEVAPHYAVDAVNPVPADLTR
jgi:hypothetical protein